MPRSSGGLSGGTSLEAALGRVPQDLFGWQRVPNLGKSWLQNAGSRCSTLAHSHEDEACTERSIERKKDVDFIIIYFNPE